MKQSKRVTNQDILTILQEFMQLTSNNFIRLENKIDNIDARLSKGIAELKHGQSIQKKITQDILYSTTYLENAAVKTV